MAKSTELFGLEFIVRDYECDLQGIGCRMKNMLYMHELQESQPKRGDRYLRETLLKNLD